MFTFAENPNKPTVGSTRRPVIVMGNNVIQGCPSFEIIYVPDI
jgi:hypothetical protein